eukprot:530198-Prorocentrum_minimum.AAC.1
MRGLIHRVDDEELPPPRLVVAVQPVRKVIAQRQRARVVRPRLAPSRSVLVFSMQHLGLGTSNDLAALGCYLNT